jgi:DNA-binding GntR family transcriptional regulator
VFDILEEAIRRGDMKPGDRVYDQQLPVKYGVSRSPVREALKRLEYFGLIRVVPRRGTYVAQLTSRGETADLYEIREALEQIAARQAVQRCPATQVQVMRAKLEAAMHRLQAGEEFGYGLNFCEWVLERSGNRALQPLPRAIHGQARLIRFRSGACPVRAQQALRAHLKILDAICERNSALAETMMHAHIRGGCENVLGLWPRSEDGQGVPSRPAAPLEADLVKMPA